MKNMLQDLICYNIYYVIGRDSIFRCKIVYIVYIFVIWQLYIKDDIEQDSIIFTIYSTSVMSMSIKKAGLLGISPPPPPPPP